MNIVFDKPNYTIPLGLSLKVDDRRVDYYVDKEAEQILFEVDTKDPDLALYIAKGIAENICNEHSDVIHCVYWRSVSFEIVEVDERYGTVSIVWQYEIKDNG